MQYMTLTEAKAKFSYVLDQIEKGEEIIITRMGKPTASIKACGDIKPKVPLLGCMAGKGIIYDDSTFNEWPEEEAQALGIID